MSRTPKAPISIAQKNTTDTLNFARAILSWEVNKTAKRYGAVDLVGGRLRFGAGVFDDTKFRKSEIVVIRLKLLAFGNGVSRDRKFTKIKKGYKRRYNEY